MRARFCRCRASRWMSTIPLILVQAGLPPAKRIPRLSSENGGFSNINWLPMNRTSRKAEVRVIPIQFLEEITPGVSIVQKLLAAMRRIRIQFEQGDILVV